MERSDHGIEMKFWVRMMVPEESACYVMEADGKDGCRIAFLAKEYAAYKRGLHLNGATVQVVEVLLPYSENRSAHLLYHHNRSYAVGENIQYPTQHNQM